LGVDREYYQPVDRGFEEKIAKRLKQIREKLKTGKSLEKSGSEKSGG
jgi:putative ATPase